MLQLIIDGETQEVQRFRFPGGETQIRITPSLPPAGWQRAQVTAKLISSDDVMALLLLTDAVRRLNPAVAIDLICPYLPYARQDRVAYPGEALSAKVFCSLINAQGFASVEVWDAHSDVALALLDRVTNVPASVFANRIAQPNDIIVAPDAGAAKRAGACAKLAGLRFVQAEKIRDTNTGAITATKVHSDHVGQSDFLIVDDICDGGRTFIELAKVLRPLTDGCIKLYVTHGIFSSGFDVLADGIDRIFVANPFPDTLPDFVRTINGDH